MQSSKVKNCSCVSASVRTSVDSELSSNIHLSVSNVFPFPLLLFSDWHTSRQGHKAKGQLIKLCKHANSVISTVKYRTTIHQYLRTLHTEMGQSRTIIYSQFQVVWSDSDRASSLICGNKTPTRCNRWYLLQILLHAQHVSDNTMPIICCI